MASWAQLTWDLITKTPDQSPRTTSATTAAVTSLATLPTTWTSTTPTTTTTRTISTMTSIAWTPTTTTDVTPTPDNDDLQNNDPFNDIDLSAFDNLFTDQDPFHPSHINPTINHIPNFYLEQYAFCLGWIHGHMDIINRLNCSHDHTYATPGEQSPEEFINWK